MSSSSNDGRIPASLRKSADTESADRRAADDARLADIQLSVHEIRSDVRSVEHRLERSDNRISDIERQVIEARASQKTHERLMSVDRERLTERIDRVGKQNEGFGALLSDHIKQQAKDTRAALSLLITILTTIIGAVGAILLPRIMGE